MSVEVPGVDLSVLAAWMDERALGEGLLVDAELITGGTQNILLRFARAGRVYVLRRPPINKRANSDETMRREARALGALSATDVPHPALIAAEADPSVLGAAFYLMESIDGFNATLGLPGPFDTELSWQHEMGLSMADAISALAAVDHVAVGLADLGRFEGWAERQVGRWRKQLDSYSELAGYAGPDIPGIDAVGEWLAARLPTDAQPGLIHGDFYFANVLISRGRPAVAAIVDWELVTIGDPLLDLGHLLATWPQRDAVGITVMADGLPTHDEVIARYAAQTTRSLDNLLWYRVLACYRLGLILEGTHARACAGLAPTSTGDQLHAHTVSLLEQALTLIS